MYQNTSALDMILSYRRNIKITQRNNDGDTAFSIAEQQGDKASLQILEKYQKLNSDETQDVTDLLLKEEEDLKHKEEQKKLKKKEKKFRAKVKALAESKKVDLKEAEEILRLEREAKLKAQEEERLAELEEENR